MSRSAIAIGALSILFVSAAAAENWGEFKRDHCTKLGVRQHSSILWNIPKGSSWEAACAAMPADIDGQHFDSPTRCVNTVFNMWGEFDVADASCMPHWGAMEKSELCESVGLRTHSAILWNIPQGVSWEDACAATPAEIDGQHFDRPTRCKNTGLNMWGEFAVKDQACDWRHREPVKKGCDRSWNYYESHFGPPFSGWEDACRNTPAQIGGNSYLPYHCYRSIIQIYASFKVPVANATECLIVDPVIPVPEPQPTSGNSWVSLRLFSSGAPKCTGSIRWLWDPIEVASEGEGNASAFTIPGTGFQEYDVLADAPFPGQPSTCYFNAGPVNVRFGRWRITTDLGLGVRQACEVTIQRNQHWTGFTTRVPSCRESIFGFQYP
jgi:hypothetical protein